jgi:dinuclear metal center YbgI/SA1388 family protein
MEGVFWGRKIVGITLKMTVQRDKIIEFCSKYLQTDSFEDYCFNGLQIEGIEKVSKIVTGVSFSRRLVKEAVSKQAQMIMVHHGIFVKDISSPFQLKGVMRGRVKAILENDINLVGYHLPLDAHPLTGNNISLAKVLGVKKTKPFDVGFVGELEKETDFEKFQMLVDRKLVARSFALPFGKKKVKKIAIISGGSSPDFEEAFRAGANVFLCGDMREEVVRKAEEVGINIINAGHYNTEKEGIRNLGEIVKKKFKIEVEFVDIPCEI